MADVLINDKYLSDIANAIREKSGSVLGYRPKEMATAIAAIPTGDATTTDSLSEQLLKRTLSGAVALTVDYLGADALSQMDAMTSLTCTAKTVQAGAISQCDKLTTVILPEATYVGQGGISGNASLTKVSLSNLKSVDNYAFGSNTKLEVLDLGSRLQSLCGSIANGCGKLTAIIIRGDSVPDCEEQSNPFPTNFKNTYSGTVPGYIYVPRDMIAAYQGYEGQPQYGRYDYWTMQSYRAIEDYPDICG